FFTYCEQAYGDPHSFPTRRSSDLGLAHRLCMGDRRVVRRGEEEGEVGGLELADRAVRVEVQRDVECLENVGGAGAGGDGTGAVLDHLEATGGGQEGGAGGDVDGVGAVATRAGGVEQRLPRDRERMSRVEEGLGCAGDVGEGLAAGADRREEGGDVDVVVLTDGHRGEDLDGLLDGRGLVVQEPQQGLERIGVGHGRVLSVSSCSTQRLRMMGPDGLSTLSGWNWRPIARSMAAAMMTSPTRVSVVASVVT